MTKSQVDKLGERLKSGNYSDDDLRLLNEFRQSVDASTEYIIGRIRELLKAEPTARPAKTTSSIIAKLKRQSICLSRIQDIAGCRIIVDDIAKQNLLVENLRGLFPHMTVIDRREKPSNGYRAVHVIIKHDGRVFEIQVRTILQHLWAEFSERLSDAVDPMLKYGVGPELWLSRLNETSEMVAQTEKLEADERTVLLGLSPTVQVWKQRLNELLKHSVNISDFSH